MNIPFAINANPEFLLEKIHICDLLASCISVLFENGFDKRSQNITKFYNRLVR